MRITKFGKALKAIEQGDIDAFARLLDAGLDLDRRVRSDFVGDIFLLPDRRLAGEKLLHHALVCKEPRAAMMLVERNVTLARPEDEMLCTSFARCGDVPLLEAAFARWEILRKNINKKGYYTGCTMLHYAAQENAAEMVRFLLDHGARTDLVSAAGQTPLQSVQGCGFDAVEALLREKDAELATTATAQGDGWKKLGDHEIAHARTEEAIGYRITTVFNFAAREVTKISANLKTGSEALETRNFDDMSDRKAAEQALAELQKRGGTATLVQLNPLWKGR
jgi:hypothetical protein